MSDRRVAKGWVGAGAVVAAGLFALAQEVPVNRLAPYVSSPQSVVDRMLEVAKLKPGETVFDLGSGDGRVLVTAAQKFGAKAVGIEISPKEVAASQERIKLLKLENRVQVIEGDLLKADISQADVVTIYLLTQSNDLLRPHLEKSLKPGARVVSHDYPIRGWKPVQVEKIDAYRRAHQLYLYEIPARK
jgi:SAM-dependent methyltransferase